MPSEDVQGSPRPAAGEQAGNARSPHRADGDAGDGAAVTVWTIGHSTHDAGAFLALVRAHHVTAVADVRRFPGSRRLPHFNAAALGAFLRRAGVIYESLPQLGGRRRPRPDSPNRAWRHEAFRGYADHLASAEFAEGLDLLLAIARRQPTAIMCAEALWWKCHRRLIADVLVVRGATVLHIRDHRTADPHVLTASATLVGTHLEYPAPTPPSLLDVGADE